MKKLQISVLALLMVISFSTTAQDVNEIVKGYFENTGGYDNWGTLKGVKMMAKVNQGGMEIPLEIVQMADGRQFTKITFQGQTIKQGVYDGTTLWNTNMQTGKAEKVDTETAANFKLDTNDFPESLYNYESKGYTVELMGKESMDGTDVFKVKVTKEPKTVAGEQVEDVFYYFFDAEAYVPLAIESEVKQGPAKGMISQIKMSDYQEVDGFFFPFSLSQGVKDGQSQPIIITSIELNPEVADTEFTFPAGN